MQFLRPFQVLTLHEIADEGGRVFVGREVHARFLVLVCLENRSEECPTNEPHVGVLSWGVCASIAAAMLCRDAFLLGRRVYRIRRVAAINRSDSAIFSGVHVRGREGACQKPTAVPVPSLRQG